ncbi:DUF2065 domain-containing protein [Aliiglaciecola sp. CAU 1673]|uniref:DUF2065 domain-containing protein n=1 Tax=Aliiglaciecola sp. CAU 1673 TaxID=3032595 RepID=UPI0023DA2447|nr:DUF2065 domain-containing protein [Aliiglaciecola sp. CAU 1673]MDF2180408.1 DUF2065 domain-containing protein [Aliiglaciecola sp. CAU 1673]
MSDAFWLAMALLLVFEGIGPMLFPNRWQKVIRQISSQSPQQLRSMGGVMVVIGLVLLWFLSNSVA